MIFSAQLAVVPLVQLLGLTCKVLAVVLYMIAIKVQDICGGGKKKEEENEEMKKIYIYNFESHVGYSPLSTRYRDSWAKKVREPKFPRQKIG